ncbi:MAG: DASS family sodium-coupled anion symporter [Acidobacteria bacterium]|nr:DASS family sodium-coupled anion symporter [Acidobacteriota bacterium]
MFRYLLFTFIRRKWFFAAIGLMCLIALTPPLTGLTSKSMAVLGITTMAIILFVSSVIPLPATALLIAFFLVLFQVDSPNNIAMTFTGDAMFFILGILLISNVLIDLRIDRRLSRLLLRFTGYNVKKLTLGIMILCAFLGATIGEHTAAALLFPVVLSLLALAKENPTEQGKLAKLMLFALAYSAMIGGMATPSGGARNPLMIEYLFKLGEIKVSYLQWMIMVLPVAVILIPVMYFIIRFSFPVKITELQPDTSVGKATGRLTASYKMEGSERLAIGIFCFILFLWIFFSDKLGMGITALLGVLIYILTGLARWSNISSRTNWGIILIYASSLALGLAMKESGLTTWFADSFIAFLNSHHLTSKPLIISTVAAVSALTSNILSHGPTVAVTGPVFLKLAEVSQMNMLVVGMINAIASSFGFLTIIAAPANSLIFTSGYIKTSDYLKVGLLCTLVILIVTVIFSLFYWNIIGYIM